MLEEQASHACDACGGKGYYMSLQVSGHFPRTCPVCLGVGYISDRMPVADAMADAETLFLADPTLDKQEWAFELFPDPTSTYWTAFFSARAAFRAVPGLR